MTKVAANRLQRYYQILSKIISGMKLGISIIRQLARPRDSRADERHAMAEECRSAARSTLTDQEAVEGLCDTLQQNNVLAESVVNALSHSRYSYVDDRAFRLAKAALSGGAVQAMYPGQRRLFEKERNLGRMPIEEAFEWLVQIVPELDEVRRAVKSQGRPIVPRFKEVDKLLGPDSLSSDELVRTRLAALVARRYLGALVGNTERGDMQTPYFVSAERPMMTMLIDRRK